MDLSNKELLEEFCRAEEQIQAALYRGEFPQYSDSQYIELRDEVSRRGLLEERTCQCGSNYSWSICPEATQYCG
jgi:hypothetical protein